MFTQVLHKYWVTVVVLCIVELPCSQRKDQTLCEICSKGCLIHKADFSESFCTLYGKGTSPLDPPPAGCKQPVPTKCNSPSRNPVYAPNNYLSSYCMDQGTVAVIASLSYARIQYRYHCSLCYSVQMCPLLHP